MKALATNLCNNVLRRGKDEKIPITPMKLQKIMYYICRDYVIETDQMPIDEQFEVWQYGPVLPSLYVEFKKFGARPITKYSKDASGHIYQVSEDINPILSRVIDIVWAKNKRKTGIELSKMTHESGSGWYRAFIEGREKITVEDMKNDTTGR